MSGVRGRQSPFPLAGAYTFCVYVVFSKCFFLCKPSPWGKLLRSLTFPPHSTYPVRDFRQAIGFGGLKAIYEEKKSRSMPLKRHEKRYEVKDERPDPECPVGVEKKRVCIYDENTKRTRFEVPTFRMAYPLLSLNGDEGPKDLPLYYFLPANGYRFFFWNDPQHKTPRDMYWAAKENEVWTDILDVTYAINWESGPYRSCSWFCQSKENSSNWLASTDEDDDMLVFKYEEICKERGWTDDPDFGMKSHYKKVMMSLSPEELFARQVAATKWTRWGSLFQSSGQFFPNWTSKEVAASALAVHLGCYKAT